MTRSEIMKNIYKNRNELRSRFLISYLSLFGSVTHNQATSESDLDTFISYEETPGPFKFFEMKSHL